ncbi:hypothetical protein B0H14DRAFT_2628022 [Mycena olivaceomarginata]|nr:hypothetical protein B0H14DRAFT_2628022 [Mycena olivaceomarginata]
MPRALESSRGACLRGVEVLGLRAAESHGGDDEQWDGVDEQQQRLRVADAEARERQCQRQDGRKWELRSTVKVSPPAQQMDERTQYVLIDDDIGPDTSTQHKLRTHAARWGRLGPLRAARHP